MEDFKLPTSKKKKKKKRRHTENAKGGESFDALHNCDSYRPHKPMLVIDWADDHHDRPGVPSGLAHTKLSGMEMTLLQYNCMNEEGYLLEVRCSGSQTVTVGSSVPICGKNKSCTQVPLSCTCVWRAYF
eukprot:SAG31_NODE_46_length_30980_cov_226.095107_22_plen_129_part_00